MISDGQPVCSKMLYREPKQTTTHMESLALKHSAWNAVAENCMEQKGIE